MLHLRRLSAILALVGYAAALGLTSFAHIHVRASESVGQQRAEASAHQGHLHDEQGGCCSHGAGDARQDDPCDHQHSDCPVCQFLALAATRIAVPELVNAGETLGIKIEHVKARRGYELPLSFDSRGPPAAV